MTSFVGRICTEGTYTVTGYGFRNTSIIIRSWHR